MASLNDNLNDDPARGTVEALARNAAAREAERKLSSIPINSDAALYRKGDEMKLGDVKTDEITIAWMGKAYIVQGFTEGILYVEEGHWDQVRRIDWGTTKDAAEGGKTEGAALGEPGLSQGDEASSTGKGERGSHLSPT